MAMINAITKELMQYENAVQSIGNSPTPQQISQLQQQHQQQQQQQQVMIPRGLLQNSQGTNGQQVGHFSSPLFIQKTTTTTTTMARFRPPPNTIAPGSGLTQQQQLTPQQQLALRRRMQLQQVIS